jgi:GAF domain-containing protein
MTRNEAVMAQQPKPLPDTAIAEYLQDLVLQCYDVEELLNELAAFSAASLSTRNEVLCGVTLMRQRKAATVAVSDVRVLPLDEMQYGFGDGPCLTAIRESTTVHVPDLHNETRWPDYTVAAWAQGIGSVLAVPLPLEGEANAALNVYSIVTHAFSSEDIETAETYASQASKALRLAVRVAQLTDDRKNLTAAMESRTTIDLAVGAIMAQNRCSQTSAFKILKIASSTRNVKLRDVASSIVASVSQDPSVFTHFDTPFDA